MDSQAMITDPSQAAEPPIVPTAPEAIQAPAATTVLTVPDFVPAAVVADLPQMIAGTDHAFIKSFYDNIPVLYESPCKHKTFPQAQLAPYPVLPYAHTLPEAEANMHFVMQYCLTYNVRSENMPPSWAVVLARVQHNIKALGGSYNVQISDTFGRIPCNILDYIDNLTWIYGTCSLHARTCLQDS